MIFYFPTYNSFKSLEHFLSFAKKDEKILVSDNSLEDKVQKFCFKHPNIIFFRKKPTSAVSNWNNGLRKISKTFMIIIHDDEFISKEFYEFITNCKLDKNIVYIQDYAVYKFNKKANISYAVLFKKLFLKFFPRLILFFNFIGPTAAYVYYKEDNLLYDKNLIWKVDVEYFYRFSRGKKFKFLPFTVSTHLKSNSITSNIKNLFEIELKETFDISKKHRISLINFIFYFCISLFFRIIKKILTFFI